MRNLKKPNRESVVTEMTPMESAGEPCEMITAETALSKTPVKRSLTRSNVSDIINRYAIMAAAIGTIPIPGSDIVAVSALQADMIEEIAREHGLRVPRDWAKRLVIGLAGSIGLTAGTRVAVSSLKALPLFGTVFGGGASLIASAATTYAIGNAFENYFRDGGTLDNSIVHKLYEEAAGYMRESGGHIADFVKGK